MLQVKEDAWIISTLEKYFEKHKGATETTLMEIYIDIC